MKASFLALTLSIFAFYNQFSGICGLKIYGDGASSQVGQVLPDHFCSAFL